MILNVDKLPVSFRRALEDLAHDYAVRRYHESPTGKPYLNISDTALLELALAGALRAVKRSTREGKEPDKVRENREWWAGVVAARLTLVAKHEREEEEGANGKV